GLDVLHPDPHEGRAPALLDVFGLQDEVDAVLVVDRQATAQVIGGKHALVPPQPDGPRLTQASPALCSRNDTIARISALATSAVNRPPPPPEDTVRGCTCCPEG